MVPLRVMCQVTIRDRYLLSKLYRGGALCLMVALGSSQQISRAECATRTPEGSGFSVGQHNWESVRCLLMPPEGSIQYLP